MSSPRWRRSPPARRAPGRRVGSGSAAPGTDTCSSGELGEHRHTDDHRGRHPVAPGRHGHVGSGPGAGRHHHRQRAGRPGGAGDRAAGPVRRGLRRRGRRRRRGRNHLVPVSLGLFDDADGLVQVTAPAWPPAKKWWSRRHDPHPATDTDGPGQGRQRHRHRRCTDSGARGRRRDQDAIPASRPSRPCGR